MQNWEGKSNLLCSHQKRWQWFLKTALGKQLQRPLLQSVWQTSTRPFLCIRPCHAWGGSGVVERYNTKKYVVCDLMELPGHRRWYAYSLQWKRQKLAGAENFANYYGCIVCRIICFFFRDQGKLHRRGDFKARSWMIPSMSLFQQRKEKAFLAKEIVWAKAQEKDRWLLGAVALLLGVSHKRVGQKKVGWENL